MRRAATLTGRHRLRAYDAVQLATALSTRRLQSEPLELLCFDADLRAAALREGLPVSPPLS